MRLRLSFPPPPPTAILAALGGVLLLCVSPGHAAEILLTVSPGLDGGPPRPADPMLRTVDPTDGSTIGAVEITLAGEVVNGGTGLARHPETGILYATLRVEGKSSRDLVTLDPETGVAVLVGSTGQKFATIAFAADGTLYGITGASGGMTAGSLFTIDPATAQSVFVKQLTPAEEVVEGEALAFNPDDGLLYHASGIGVPNDPLGEEFETIDPVTLDAALVTLSGADYEELTALAYAGGGSFYAGDIGGANPEMPALYRVSTTGAVTYLGAMDHVAKGIVVPEPSHVALTLAALCVLCVLARSQRRRTFRPGLSVSPSGAARRA